MIISYPDLDSYLIKSAYNDLPNQEKHFISNAKLKEVSARFSIKLDDILINLNTLLYYQEYNPKTDENYNSYNYYKEIDYGEISREIQKDVYLFKAENGSEERIYCLKKINKKYELLRVDRDQKNYFDLVSPPINKVFDNYLITRSSLEIINNNERKPSPKFSKIKDIICH